MKTFLIIGIDFKPTRTKIGLVNAHDGTVLETIIFRAEKSDMDKLLSGIEHGVEIFNSKSNFFRGTVCGIGVVWPADSNERDAVPSLWQMMDEEILKNILEKRFSVPCRIEREDQILAVAENSYGAVGENAGIQGCAALFALNQKDKI